MSNEHMEKYSKDEITKYSKRIQKSMKKTNLSIGIGALSRTCNVPQSKIRYWQQKGYITCKNKDKNTNYRYPFSSLFKVELIKSFLDSGYTLAKSAEKASFIDDTGELLHKLIYERFESLDIVDGKTSIDMGPIEDDPNKHIHFVNNDGKMEARIIQHKS